MYSYYILKPIYLSLKEGKMIFSFYKIKTRSGGEGWCCFCLFV
jgi:hypothetical protein